MNIILIDTEKYTSDFIQNIANYIKQQSENDKWIFLPKDFNVLIDCSTQQLSCIRDYIDDAIREKNIINNI